MLNKVCFVAAAGQYGMGCRRSRRQDPIPICPAAAIPPPPPPPPPAAIPRPPAPPPRGAPTVVAPRVICPLRSLALAPPRPPRGAHVSIPLVCATFPDFWLNSHTIKVK